MRMKILIQGYNPYEAKYPKRRTISREVLALVKMIRKQGYEVLITPEIDKRVEYITRKGFGEIFQEPIVIFISNISLSIITSIISSWLYEYLKSRKSPLKIPDETNIAIVID